MDFKGMKVLVVGFAKSGEAVASFLARRGADVIVTDMKPAGEFIDHIERLKKFGVTFELGYHDPATFLAQTLIIVSPGVPLDMMPLQKAKAKGVEIISEIEFGSRLVKAPILGITGTNGKTTTTTIAGQILKNSGFSTFVGGNIGTPLIELADSGEKSDRIVLELSSFQLEGIKSFKPKTALLLNITEDHLDRYNSYQDYIDAKKRLFMNMGRDDFAVMNIDDVIVAKIAEEIRCKVVPFSRNRSFDEGGWIENGIIHVKLQGDEHTFDTATYLLKGMHNEENMMAAILCAMTLGADPSAVDSTLKSFKGLSHRMELVRTFNGIAWYEDSKATNVGSVEKALASFDNITLIAGGKDKGGSYKPLETLVRERVRHLVLIGEAKERIQKELGHLTNTIIADTLEDAVTKSFDLTEKGGTVLFSPACSSFDMFKDYLDRALQYRNLVHDLPEKSP